MEGIGIIRNDTPQTRVFRCTRGHTWTVEPGQQDGKMPCPPWPANVCAKCWNDYIGMVEEVKPS